MESCTLGGHIQEDRDEKMDARLDDGYDNASVRG